MASYPTADNTSFSAPLEYPSAPQSEYSSYQYPPTPNHAMNHMQYTPVNQAQTPAPPPTVYMMPPVQGNDANALKTDVEQKPKVAAISSSNLKFGKTPQSSICPNCGQQVITRVILKNCTGCKMLRIYLVILFIGHCRQLDTVSSVPRHSLLRLLRKVMDAIVVLLHSTLAPIAAITSEKEALHAEMIQAKHRTLASFFQEKYSGTQ
ncbi:hypothetical protein GAYE_SCF07G2912 [Galdieria yellowstonensis]|uniref:LITAF domain-containing protein n=1 Tax=Galdieria yellowstonensis TaxID=3028027 RepID=A0AAV9ICG5_9RHOD|nr:hypothetical protein GAYE_SCF07G2912 [Galdieria yellowstonensis]